MIKELILILNVFAGMGNVADQTLANAWNVELSTVQALPLELRTISAVESADGFNPFSVNFENVEAFENDTTLDHNQAWKWLRYRREEIGICFEDEFLNVDGRCEPYNDQ